jgi:tRNA threonylcarbamoyladenosine biosynthesis protein TsaB
MIPTVSIPTDRFILAVDTSGGTLSVSLLDGADVLERASSELRAGAVLHDLVGEILARRRLRFADLALLAVARGPGSFTGLRVGLAAAAGLAIASGLPAVGIETSRAAALASGRTGLVAVLLEGGPGRLYGASYDVGTRHAAIVEAPLDLSLEEGCRLARRARFAVVRGHPREEAMLLAAGCVPVEGPIAEFVGMLARDTEPCPRTLEALYLRVPALRTSSP